jgi:hypothetical protein
MRALHVRLLIGALLLAPVVARADALRVTTDEAGAWPAAVAVLQGDLHGEGRTLHVRVSDDEGASLGCRDYTLVLDEISQAAFVIVGCDDSTGATEVRLVHRNALFEPDDVAPRPRLAGISAVQVRTGGARGGARRTGASEVLCTVAVRPYVEDILNGRHVFLTPGRFALRSLSAGVTAEARPDGWLLRSDARADVSIEYDVVDTRSNETVVHTRATMACARSEQNSAESPANVSPPPSVDPSCRGRTSLAIDANNVGSTSSGSTTPTYVLLVDRERHLHVRASGDFVGEADVYRGCSGIGEREAVLRIAPGSAMDQSLTLEPGAYTVVIEDADRRPHRGVYSLAVQYDARDPSPRMH